MNDNTRYEILDGSMLKLAAMISMTIDHLGVAGVWLAGALMESGVRADIVPAIEQVCEVMRDIGRMAFPLYAFLLVEGFFHTSSRGKYARRLLLFALLSEAPFDLLISGRLVDVSRQNVLFTLLIGLLTIWAMSWIDKNCRFLRWITVAFQAAVFLLGTAVASLLYSDYSYKGVALITIFYIFYHFRTAAAITGYCSFFWEFWSFPGFLLLLFYNGKRGRKIKFRFYFYYPLHLLIIYLMLIILKSVL